MRFNKLLLVTLTLALAVFLFVACGSPAETNNDVETNEPETNAPETNAPETNAPETNAPEVHTHDIAIEEVAATCTTDGYHKEACKTCGEVIIELAYPKTACTPASAATCISASVCSVCGKQVEPAKGHTWGDAVVVAATCKMEGTSTKTCTVCNEATVEKLAMVGHKVETFTEEVLPAGCGGTGYRKGTCVTCNEVVTTTLNSSHEFANEKFVIADDGTITGVCTLCGKTDKLSLETVLKLGFENTDLQTEVAANAQGSFFTVGDTSNTRGKFIADAGKTYMAPTGAVFVDFDPTLFAEASYYVVSFDFSFNQEKVNSNARPTLFAFIPGCANEGKDQTSAMSWGTVAKFDTSTNKLVAVPSNGAEITSTNNLDIEYGEWYTVTIIVNNTTGERIAYYEGVYKGVPIKDGKINEATIERCQGKFCFRFTDLVDNAPYIDNFSMYVVK